MYGLVYNATGSTGDLVRSGCAPVYLRRLRERVKTDLRGWN